MLAMSRDVQPGRLPIGMATTQVTRRAHGKINLMLSVGNALPPEGEKAGYHPMLSWFHAIDLHDTLTVKKAASSGYEISWASDAPRGGEIDWPLEKDLAVRAHRALEAHVGKALPVAMRLEKRVPTGGGLGGGSSDAAAMLLAVREVYGLDVTDETLREIAMTLGSDIAFFIDEGDRPRPAIVGGLGELIERVAPLESDVILVVPGFGCATGEVYKAFDEQRAKEMRDYEIERALSGTKGRERTTGPRETMVRGRVERAIKASKIDTEDLFNDLAKPAFGVEPRLGRLVTTLSNICRSPAHVTGSGSCVFVVPEAKKVEWMMGRVAKALEAVREEVGACNVVVSKTV